MTELLYRTVCLPFEYMSDSGQRLAKCHFGRKK